MIKGLRWEINNLLAEQKGGQILKKFAIWNEQVDNQMLHISKNIDRVETKADIARLPIEIAEYLAQKNI